LNDEIITTGGLKLFLDPSWNPEWNASVTGVVFGVPVNCPENINIGDEVAFSYTVVADRSSTKIDYFQPIFQPTKFFKRYVNQMGHKLTVVAMPGNVKPIWAGTLVNRRNELIDGVQGSESDCERWLSQFNFSSHQDLRFNNLFNFNGKDYWKAELTDIFAKRVKGEIVAIGDRIIMSPVEENIKERIEIIEGKILPYQSVKVRYQDRGKIISGGEDLGLKKGDIVAFDQKYLERYKFWGKDYYLIKKHRISGLWQ
jgi:hypothetical protein